MPQVGQDIGFGPREQPGVTVSGSVGGTAPTWSGVFLLMLPDRPPPDLDTAKDLISRLVQIWRPQDMTWSTDELREAGWDAGLPMKKGVPFAGWLTWVSPDLDDPLPGPVEELAGGRLHVLAPTADEATVDRVLHVLKGTGPTSTP